MLTYLINVTGDLFTVCLITGVIFAFIDHFCRDRGKLILRIGLAAGLVIAAVRAYITNTQRLAGGWRVGAYGYAVSLAFFVMMIILFIIFRKSFFHRSPEENKGYAAETAVSVSTALLLASCLYGAVPNVYVYPFKFDTGGNGYLSTDYLFRLGGYLLGIVVCLIAMAAARSLMQAVANKGYEKLLTLTFIILNCMYAVYNFASLMLVLTPRKIVDSVTLFNFAAFSNNHKTWYGFAAFLIILAVAVFFWIRSYSANETYITKAQHRKQRVIWRNGKRSAVALAVCLVCAILCATWFVKLNTVVIQEAPVENPEIVQDANGEDSVLKVPLEMVSDGHLHRFGYDTPEGKSVRFIVVLKQENTTNYGIGLDACDICGEAGYYENNEGQVVCKKCNVVMNKTTIGMKGGCNPIIIDYDIDENYITVPVSEMIKNQERFTK